MIRRGRLTACQARRTGRSRGVADLRLIIDGRDSDELVFVSPEGSPLRWPTFMHRPESLRDR
ncbi:hypothetical protein SAMN04489717_3393 [Actinopolymorpha singaporensis]|uniref:Uncharacterized protein n=1 Tax=Actinopolymorpha singaporensis TaxID=117157 RepID=A0A1H1TZ89_9ACTN|nr:hypothetical protein SAMN04489717_3393 [Actinopolymorpha singaporensis]